MREAAAHGFEGEFRGDELTWSSQNCDGCNPNDPQESNIVAAKYYARAILLHLGMDITPGVGGTSSSRKESYFTIQNICALLASARSAILPVTIQSEATRIKSFSFSLPNGDELLVVWNDVAAVNFDPGFPSTIDISGYAGSTVIGIDVIYGFSQELIASNENGDLVIHDFQLKDYPIIILLSK
jgi:hypothetical protein